MGEDHGKKEREYTITMAIIMVFSSLLGFLRLNPLYVGMGLPLYKLCQMEKII